MSIERYLSRVSRGLIIASIRATIARGRERESVCPVHQWAGVSWARRIVQLKVGTSLIIGFASLQCNDLQVSFSFNIYIREEFTCCCSSSEKERKSHFLWFPSPERKIDMIFQLFMSTCLVETLVFQEMSPVVKWDEQEFNWIDRSSIRTVWPAVQRRSWSMNTIILSFLSSRKYQTSAYESGIFPTQRWRRRRRLMIAVSLLFSYLSLPRMKKPIRPRHSFSKHAVVKLYYH